MAGFVEALLARPVISWTPEPARRAQDADALSTALVADMRVAQSLSGVAAPGIGQVPASLVMRRRANA
jgi:hypothetical protein